MRNSASCRETTLKESQQVDHWTSGTVYECSEIAGSPQFYPLTMLVVKPEGGPAASMKPGQKSCEIK
jgi:hypothetical protein